jgi:type IV pilus assembly protein PilB
MSAAPPNTAPQVTTPGLARALMQGNLLTAAQTDTIVKKTQIDKTRFIDGLLQSNIISPRDLATFCSETFGYPLMDLSVINESLIPDKLVDPKLMQTQRLVPIAKKETNWHWQFQTQPTTQRSIRLNSRPAWA